MGFDQSMSDADAKSCVGTYCQTRARLSWVTFKTPSIARANFDLRYVEQFCASDSVSNAPIVMNVPVTATAGSSTRAGASASPNAPDPLAFGRATLYL